MSLVKRMTKFYRQKQNHNIKLLNIIIVYFMPILVLPQIKPELIVQAGHTNDVTALALSKDGRYLASGDMGGAIKVWDVSTFQLMNTFHFAYNPIKEMFFNFRTNSLIGRSFNTGTLSRYMYFPANEIDSIQVIDFLNNKKKSGVPAPAAGDFVHFKDKYGILSYNNYSEFQGTQLFKGTNLIALFPDTLHKPYYKFVPDKVTDMDIDSTGKFLAVGYDSGKVEIRYTSNFAYKSEFDFGSEPISKIKFIPNSESFAAMTKYGYSGIKGKIVIGNINSPKTIYQWEDKKDHIAGGEINSFDISHDGKYLIWAYGVNRLCLYDLQKNELAADTSMYDVGYIFSVTFLDDNYSFVVGGKTSSWFNSGNIYLSDINSFQINRTFSYPGNSERLFQYESGFLSDNSIYNFYSDKGELNIYNASDLKPENFDYKKLIKGSNAIINNLETKSTLISSFFEKDANTVHLLISKTDYSTENKDEMYLVSKNIKKGRITELLKIPENLKRYNKLNYINSKLNCKVFGSTENGAFALVDNQFNTAYSDTLYPAKIKIVNDTLMIISSFSYWSGISPELKIINLKNYMVKYDFVNPDSQTEIKFILTENNSKLVFTDENNDLKNKFNFLNLNSFSIDTLIEYNYAIAALGASGENIAVGTYGKGYVFIADTNGKFLNLDSLNSIPINISFNDSGNKMMVLSSNGISHFYDMQNREKIFSKIELDNSRCFVTDNNYYFADKSALKFMGFKIGANVFPFEQFDAQYNRPDIVLEKYGYSENEVIEVYKKAVEKRNSLLGNSSLIDFEDFHLPEIKFENGKIPASTKNKIVKLNINAYDSIYAIKKINIFINDVPCYGSNGIDTKDENNNKISLSKNIELSNGQNKIQISAVNSKGVESLKRTAFINYIGEEAEPDLYLIAVSVSEYADSNFNLNYARKDGMDIINLFGNNRKEFGNIFIDTPFNQNAIKENFLKLKDKLNKSNVDDQVIVFISGHGLLDEKLDFYFASYDCDFSNPSERGLSYNSIENLLDGIPARNKLLMMDACHSGEIDKENTVVNSNVTLSDGSKGGLVSYDYRGASVQVFEKEKALGLKNNFELMQELFSNLNRGSGAVVISAAAGKGYALESPKWKNGVFTFSVKSALTKSNPFFMTLPADKNNDRKITVSELKDFVDNAVVIYTNGAQKPTTRRENLENNFVIFESN